MQSKGYVSSQFRFTRVVNATAAGTTDINGSSVDMSADGGYDGVIFVALYGTLTATQVTKLVAQGSSDDSTFTTITGGSCDALADADSNKCQIVDVYQPASQYVRPMIDRGTANAVVDGVFAIQYKGRTPPAANGSTIKQLLQVANA